MSDLPFSNDCFDALICNHVLEHVPDDHRAMAEMRRVLKPGGRALVTVPRGDGPSKEDPSVTSPEERLRLYGDTEHVRYYGEDFRDRLLSCGFQVESYTPQDILENEAMERMSIAQCREFIDLCTA